MHSTISDGTDTPVELLGKIRDAGIGLWSLTDHDDTLGCRFVSHHLVEGDPAFIPGVEFSCKDEEGKYHIIGYGYDIESPEINNVVNIGHTMRMEKAKARVEFVVKEFGFELPQEEINRFLNLPNPGKPHLGNLLVKYGYCDSKEKAINEYIDKAKIKDRFLRPETAIEGILRAGGIPVLAHPIYGSGDQLILGEEMDDRLRRLVGFGLKGVEGFYSGFTFKMNDMMLAHADKYDLYVTAGSDYHGTNKMIELGDTGLDDASEGPARLLKFMEMFL